MWELVFNTPKSGKLLNSLYGIFVLTIKSATLYVLLFIDIFGKLIFDRGYYSFTYIA